MAVGNSMTEKDKWSDYWQTESAAGEVFVDKNGEKHKALGEFWRHCLDSLPEGTSIVDLASGAGSIFADLSRSKQFDLHAADLSPEALSKLKERLPQVQTKVCSASALPYSDGTFDIVVSQFGIEYAGQAGFIEAARVVKKGGYIHVLCHIEDGYIDSKNKSELHGAQLVKELAFIEKAIAVTDASFQQNQALLKKTFDQFVAVEPLLADYVNNSTQGIHHHLYHGFKTLFIKREAYSKQDILSWLEGMQKQVDESIIRLSEMRKAASSADDMKEITSKLTAMGMKELKCEPFLLPDHQLPVAWYLSSTK